MSDHHDSARTARGALPTDTSRLARGIAALAVVFTAVAVCALWGWEDELPPPPDEHRIATVAPAPEGVTSTTGEAPSVVPTPVPGETGSQERVMKPREVVSLLSEEFQFRSEDGKLGFAKLRSALVGERTVTILNVWAPYCEPCKREFPGFRKLQEGWGTQVRFLPIQLGEGDPTELKEAMPAAPHHLIDHVPGGVVQRNLAALGLLPKDAPIPITVVLDCKEKLRWVQVGEVKDMQEFDRVIKGLIGEFTTSYCASPRPPEVGKSERCGDGRCELGEEDCDSCRKDCGCRPGQLCSRRAGGRHLCVHEVE